LEDLDFPSQTQASISCNMCGKCYYIEAGEGESLEGLKQCIFCASYTLTFLKENLHEHYTHRNGDFIEISCEACNRKFNFGSSHCADIDVFYCGFCGSEAYRSN
jgi:redox-regulated HSP33 family molecular chaperone